ncbi:hypothetical protein KXD93_22525 [Mucilaginibacter sp. BJC16-A38]|uniref:hypothetical protein n=1 Tax=Mucilaginibacter phenanthrenivorans TaxID=1234842 RepID=UPI00215804B0|nr:hypothetical protein [Mucilaginibacter phenanthrenivorans]MCR8560447.1 hypothetical protein [Mucilaginibacter phenanthrenivorans]
MRHVLLIVFILLFLAGCGGKKNNPVPDPSPVLLTTPAQDEVCTTGNIISSTESTVSFIWDASANTDSYDLVITDLLTNNQTTKTTSQTHFEVILTRNTPYSWYVVSKSAKSAITSKSEVWKFYNAGAGTVSYAPFPADIIYPAFGEVVSSTNNKINLSWKGSSVTPASIANYDVYLGTIGEVALAYSAVKDSFVNDVVIAKGTTYYWRIITRDTSGNTSDSGLFAFTVK